MAALAAIESTKVKDQRLPKRLLYVLRYGALKEGLDVDRDSYVDISQLTTINLLKGYSQEELLEEIQTSVSFRKKNRYEWKTRFDTIYVRAAYMRNFEQNPYHGRTGVKTLFETSMTRILDNLDLYDLEDFPEENIIRLMLRRLTRRKAITNKKLAVLFVPTLTRISLEGIYLTNNTLRMLWTQCPHLKAVSLKHCGYIITDTVLTKVIKNLPRLEHLNLTYCQHLTDKSLAILSKHLPDLRILQIAAVRSINPKCVRAFLQATKKLTLLDVYYMRTTPEEHKELLDLAKAKGVELVLRDPKGTTEDTDDSDCDDEDEQGDEHEDEHDDEGDSLPCSDDEDEDDGEDDWE